jgi:hypothetical protein
MLEWHDHAADRLRWSNVIASVTTAGLKHSVALTIHKLYASRKDVLTSCTTRV